MTTRSSSEVWLIGQPIRHLWHSKLPSKKAVVCLLMNYKNDKQEKEAFNLKISDVLLLWQKAGIPSTVKKLTLSFIQKPQHQKVHQSKRLNY